MPNPQQLSDLRSEVDSLCRQLLANPTNSDRRRVVGRRLRVLSFLLKRYDNTHGQIPFADLGGTPDTTGLTDNEIKAIEKSREDIRFAKLESPSTNQTGDFPEANFCDNFMEARGLDPYIDFRLYHNLKRDHREVSAKAIFEDLRGYPVPQWIMDGKELPVEYYADFSPEEIKLFNRQQDELRKSLGIRDDTSSGHIEL